LLREKVVREGLSVGEISEGRGITLWNGGLGQHLLEEGRRCRRELILELNEALLEAYGVVGIAFALYKVEVVGLVSAEVGVVEDVVGAALDFGFVEVVHVELSDERGEVVVLEVSRQDLFAERFLVLDHE
jgi:hypothetical protein